MPVIMKMNCNKTRHILRIGIIYILLFPFNFFLYEYIFNRHDGFRQIFSRSINFQILNNTFYDLDRGIEKRFNLTIKDIFQEYGENKFREVESKLLADSVYLSKNVIATGGGIVLDPENLKLLRDQRVYFLDASIQILYERAIKKRDQRPLLKDVSLMEFAEIYEQRKTLYNECATKVISTDDRSIEEIAKEIIEYEQFNI